MLSFSLPLPVPTLQEFALWIAIAVAIIGGALLAWRSVLFVKASVEKWLVPRREWEQDLHERDHQGITDIARDKKLSRLVEELVELLKRK